MVGPGFHKAIRLFIVLALIVSLFFEGYFNYAVTLALIYLMFRTQLEYVK